MFVEYAEIVASISWEFRRPRHSGQHRRVHRDDMACDPRWRCPAGQGHHHPESGGAADDHARHRVLDPCRLRPRCDRGVNPRDGGPVAKEYVPGYTLRADPQFDDPREIWNGHARVAVFLEVLGNETTCPPSRKPRHHDRRGCPGGRPDGPEEEGWNQRMSEMTSVPQRRGGADEAEGADYRLDAARWQPCHGPPVQRGAGALRGARPRSRRRRGHRGHPRRWAGGFELSTTGFSLVDDIKLIAAAVEEAKQAKIAVLMLRARHRQGSPHGP